MIELSPLARPYAKAVFSAALDAGNHEGVAKDLTLLSAVSQTSEVTCLIEDPELSKEKIAQTIISIVDEHGFFSVSFHEVEDEVDRYVGSVFVFTLRDLRSRGGRGWIVGRGAYGRPYHIAEKGSGCGAGWGG